MDSLDRALLVLGTVVNCGFWYLIGLLILGGE